MKIIIISLFPTQLEQYFLKGIFKRGVEKGLFSIEFIDLRAFAKDKHHKVDDYPFGYKKGMLLKADILVDAIKSIDQYQRYRLLYTCPKGPVFDQSKAKALTNDEGIILIVGYYKGIDERLFELLPIERLSLGNFVLSSGELPALVITESILRQLPGVVGKQDCVLEDSIISGLLYPPEFTLPRDIGGEAVPDILTSGHHGDINRWRHRQSLEQTLTKKPSLLVGRHPSKEDRNMMTEILKEV